MPENESKFEEPDLGKDVQTENTAGITEQKPLSRLDESEAINKLEMEKNDQHKLAEARNILNLEMEKNDGWKVIRKPKEQWKQEREITADSPFDRLRSWLKSFSKTEKEYMRINKELQKQFEENRIKYPETGFDYEKGIGVEGMVGNEVGILARGFGECSGLIFQTSDKVAVIHISPNVFRDAFEGGEIVKDKDVWGHIRFALKELLSKKQRGTAKKTNNNANLSKEEIAELKKMIDSGDLKSTMLSGEDNFVPHEISHHFGELAKFENLPFMKIDVHYVGAIGGESGYAIYANPEDMYYIGSNGKMMKKGENLPSIMYEYKDKEK